MNVVFLAHCFQKTLYSFDQSRNYFNVTWSVVQIRSTERNNAIRSESQKTESHTILPLKISQLFFFISFCSNKHDIDTLIFCQLCQYGTFDLYIFINCDKCHQFIVKYH